MIRGAIRNRRSPRLLSEFGSSGWVRLRSLGGAHFRRDARCFFSFQASEPRSLGLRGVSESVESSLTVETSEARRRGALHLPGTSIVVVIIILVMCAAVATNMTKQMKRRIKMKLMLMLMLM